MTSSGRKNERRSVVSGALAVFFARPIVVWFKVDESVDFLRATLRKRVASLADSLLDASAKTLAWLMLMAVLFVIGATWFIVIDLRNIAGVEIVGNVIERLMVFAGLMSFLHGLRIAFVWRRRFSSVDHRSGFLGRLQNPGDLDVVVGLAVFSVGLACMGG